MISHHSFLRNKNPYEIIRFVSIVCILISAKQLEKVYPSIDNLMYLTECHQFTYEDFIYIEAFVLQELDYNIHFITPYDILLHFCCQGLIYSSDWILANEGGYHKPNNECAKVVTHNAKNLCMQISLNHYFLKYDSFSLVCGIIMASRNLVRMKEDWPDELYLMTNLLKCGKQVIHVRDDILNFFGCGQKHNKSFNNETTDYRGSTN